MQRSYRWLLVAPLAMAEVCCLAARPADGAEQLPATARTKEAEIAALVERLGSDDYFVRRDAEQQLLQIGSDAFDALKKAERAADLEIAARAGYILQQLRVQWSRGDDSLEVRQILNRYDELADERRTGVIDRLARLSDYQGVGALARIARFDDSPLVARQAALAIMEMDFEQQEAIDHLIEREIGASRRTSANWLRALTVELRDPRAATRLWRRLAEEEATLLADDQEETSWRMLERLWDHELQHSNARGTVVETTAALVHRIETAEAARDAAPEGLRFAIDWCLKHGRWRVLELLEQRYAEAIRASRELLYYLAAAYFQEGKPELAEQTADAAFRLTADDDESRSEIASALAERGQFGWAEREWNYVIDNFSEVDVHSVIARFELAGWRFDREQYREAAELLTPSCEAIANNQAEQMRLKEALESNSRAPELNDFIGRRDYYLARHLESIGDFEGAARRLELSAATYPRNIDVLIAMRHVPGADELYRTRARTRIKKVQARQEAEIERWNDPAIRDNEIARRYLAGLYNEWAWLTANTSEDPKELKQAIEASTRSLALRPGEPAFLDTLGRCYYSAGDYANAVKHQRLAVEQEPELQVMRRQMELFENALAEQTAAEVQEPSPPDESP